MKTQLIRVLTSNGDGSIKVSGNPTNSIIFIEEDGGDKFTLEVKQVGGDFS